MREPVMWLLAEVDAARFLDVHRIAERAEPTAAHDDILAADKSNAPLPGPLPAGVSRARDGPETDG
jgi:hypothetical protein